MTMGEIALKFIIPYENYDKPLCMHCCRHNDWKMGMSQIAGYERLKSLSWT